MSSTPTRRPDEAALENRRRDRQKTRARKPRRDARSRAERRWRFGTGILLLLAPLPFAVTVWSQDAVRLGYGIASALLLLVAMLYAGRRRIVSMASKRRLGQAQTWLLAHVYGSVLFLAMLLLHSGLQWPHGAFSWTLWLLSVWTVVSGLLGLAAQRAVPRLLTSGAGIEAHYERIPELVGEIRRACDELAAAAAAPVQVLYERRLSPALAEPTRNPVSLLGTGRYRRRLEPLAHLRTLVDDEERRRLDELERLYSAKLDLDTHYTLQHLLRSWLWLHVPPAALLFVLVIVHIASVLYY